MNFFSNFFSFLQKNKKNIFYISLFVGIFFLLNDLSFAADPVNQDQTQTSSLAIQVFNQINNWFAVLLGFMTFLVGLFLYPDWTSGAVIWIGGSDGALKQMWILISNVVYFVFALIFIGIAFMNVIGKVESFQIKQALPRFILGVLVVPFTWFFVQFILSLSSLLTIWVLSLPYDTFKDTYFSKDKLDKVKLCSEYVINSGTLEKNHFPIECKEWSAKKPLSEFMNVKDSQTLFGITTVYTYGVMWFDESGRLFKKDIISWLGDIFALWGKALFDIVFVIIYSLLMIALAVALLVRGVALWFYAMFSPAFWLLLFFKKWEVDAGSKFKFGIKEFISLAFVPVYVSAALAFGLLFIFAAAHSLTSNNNSTWRQILNWESIDFGGFTYNFKGWGPVGAQAKEELGKLIGDAKGTVGTLMLQVLGLAILYMALMAALKQSSITASVLDPFEKIWGLIAKSPLYMPIPGAGWQSLASLNTAVQTFTSTISSYPQQKWNELGRTLAEPFGSPDPAVSKLQSMIAKPYSEMSDIQAWMKEALWLINDSNVSNPGVMRNLSELFQKKFWASDDLAGKIAAARTRNALAAAIGEAKATDWTNENKGAVAAAQGEFKGQANVLQLIWATPTATSQTPPPAAETPANTTWPIAFTIEGTTTQISLNVPADLNSTNALAFFKGNADLNRKITKEQFEKDVLAHINLNDEEKDMLLTSLSQDWFFTSRTP